MTHYPELNTPWTLHFDRDGTEDFGVIRDTDGNDLVASHLPSTARGDRTFQSGTFWLPEYEGDPVPLLVRQMKLMAAAPMLLAMLRVAMDDAKVDCWWLDAAMEAHEAATGMLFGAEGPCSTPYLYRAAARMYAALEACEKALCDIFARYQQDGDEPAEAEKQARKEAFAALCEARGHIAF